MGTLVLLILDGIIFIGSAIYHFEYSLREYAGISVISTRLLQDLKLVPTLFVICSLILLGGYGRSSKTVFGPIIFILAIVTFIGAFFKIMHWPSANFIFLGGIAFVPIVYTVSFMVRENKTLLDICKLLWVLTFASGRTLIMLHQPFGHELDLVAYSLLVICMALFLKERIAAGDLKPVFEKTAKESEIDGLDDDYYE